MRSLAMHAVCVVALLLVVGHAARVNFQGDGVDQAARVSGQSEAESATGTARANSSSNGNANWWKREFNGNANWPGPKMFVESDCAESSLVEVDSSGDLVQPDPSENATLAELQSRSATITFQITKSTVKGELKSKWGVTSGLATSGSATLSLALNKDVRGKWTFKKTKVVLIGTVGAVTLYATVGMDVALTMSAYIGVQLDIPINWDICASGSGSCGHAAVNMGTASVKRWFGHAEAQGRASFNVGLLIEKASVVATKVAAVSTLTFNRNTCTVDYDVQAKVKGLSTATWLTNQALNFVKTATGSCLNEFDSPTFADIVSRRIWSGGCGYDLR